MAVAEKPRTKSSPSSSPIQRLALASVMGAVYLLFCLAVIFGQLPILWTNFVHIPLGLQTNLFLSTALLLFLTAGVSVGLVFLGRKLEGPNPVAGLRAGSVVLSAGLLLTTIVSLGAVTLAVNQLTGMPQTAKMAVAWGVGGVLGVASLAGLYVLFNLPGFSRWLVEFEQQGWFHATAFKPSQGVRVRRGTLIGLLVLIGFGVYTFARQGMFRAALGDDWTIAIPGLEYSLFLLHSVRYTAPLAIFGILAWVSWRLVNFPTFADFLIATEAEMNKVSWITRKRLIQDTIVVLVTVLLLTIFLFVVDILWIRILSIPGVLQIDPKAAAQKQLEESDW